MSPAFDDLLDRYLHGEATADDLVALEQALRAAPARRALVDRMLLEAHLYRACAALGVAGQTEAAEAEAVGDISAVCPRPQMGSTPAAPSRLRSWQWLAAASAVAACLALAVGLWWPRGRSPTPAPGVPDRPAAPVASPQPQVAQRPAAPSGLTPRTPAQHTLVQGERTRSLPDGVVEQVSGRAATLRLADGSTAVLQPGSRFRVLPAADDRRLAIDLSAGRAEFTVTRGGGSFEVLTPVGVVRVLGTRFTVALPTEHQMDVAVADGRVEVVVGQQRWQLAAGEQHRFGPAGAGGTVTGELAGVDTYTYTLKVRLGEEQERTYTAAPDVVVWIDGHVGNVEELHPGQPVTLRVAEDGKRVTEVRAGGDGLAGLVKRLERPAGRIVLVAARQNQGEGADGPAYLLAAEVAVTVAGQPGTLDDVKPGQRVVLHFGPDGRTVVAVRVATQPRAKDGGDREGGPARGTGP